MALRAKLDLDMVYWGPEEVAALGPDDVPAPDDVIRPGAYRWTGPDANHPQWRWEPLPPTQVKKVESAPSLEQAFSELLEIGGVTPGPRAKAWLDHYKTTVDSIGEEK